MKIAEMLTNQSMCSRADRSALADGINFASDVAHDLASESGWWTDPETGEDVRNWPPKFFKLWIITKLALCMTEGAEAIEGERKSLQDDHLAQYRMRDVELADMLIRILDLAGGLGVPLGEIVVAKLTYNATRADHKLENRTQAGGKAV